MILVNYAKTSSRSIIRKFPGNNYLFKVNNRDNTKKVFNMFKVNYKDITKTSGVSFVNFEHKSVRLAFLDLYLCLLR